MSKDTSTPSRGPTAAPGSSSLLGALQTVGNAPVFVADTDDPDLFGKDGEIVNIANNFIARTRYFEQNAQWRVTAVPEPGTLALLGLGLAALGFSRRPRPS